ncbi:hypothetical protein MJ904_22015 [Massilia sp. MB5]|uniref:hypothetical protein n=1 Tax=unclassified Massilia TaxID=2609279 RepID=UPI00067BB5CF|nr:MULTISPECIES: hypothetical protein [unclassified Massilia]AKU20796.1 hypothetical protein ACZ75_04010 [Massilia sp. NR 4-1]UMR29693.1 hypothetical protein MJ904_22015 [Massilia sp. MB5]
MMEFMRDGDTCEESNEALAARFEVSFDGKRYAYRQYRYELFCDALRYARAEHAKQGFLRDKAFQACWKAPYAPSDAEQIEMGQFGIAYAKGHYLYGGYRYSQLSDAVAYAARHPGL